MIGKRPKTPAGPVNGDGGQSRTASWPARYRQRARDKPGCHVTRGIVPQCQRLAVVSQHPLGFAGQPGQLTVRQHCMTIEVHSQESRPRVVVGHQI
jgi:hypothetical protein